MKTAIILHLYYQDLWPEFKEKIIPILSDDVHLYISVVNSDSTHISDMKLYSNGVYLVDNRGLDFGPFLLIYNELKNLNYKFVIKLHSKKSLHSPDKGKRWRVEMLNSLLGSSSHFNNLIKYMETNTDIYMGGCGNWFRTRKDEWYTHSDRVGSMGVIKKVADILNVEDHGSFFAGSMFITSTLYLDKLFNNIDIMEFYNHFEYGYSIEGLVAHGMERVIGYGVEFYNGKYLTI
jgi:lipopolysaccharide biosynthesis protein